MPHPAPAAAAATVAGGAPGVTRRGRATLASLVLLPALGGCAGRQIAADPLTPEEHLDLGVAYYQTGAYDRAIAEFERATAVRSGWTRAWINLGDARLAAGDIGPAIQAYERAVALDPDDPGAANNLAWALLQDAGRWPEAEAIVRRALARRPDRQGYYLDTLGVALLRKGDTEGALAAFGSALQDPGLSDAAARALVLEHAAAAYAGAGDQGAAARCRALAEETRRHPGTPGTVRVGRPGSVC
jgi:tetratricopeptide (TPR) repeat protein